MKNLINTYAQEFFNILLGIIPFAMTIFNDPVQKEDSLYENLVTAEDRQKFYDAVEELRKSENKGQTRTITFSNQKTVTIAVG
jgi:hypothetical protein|nr:MAG TPA: hypothetical protein [Caudoviricetes sp.]